ncbi:MAG: ThiF family adenylyltransferase, partial [Halobacteria archaeon]
KERYYDMKFHTCILAGLGGVGSLLAEPLARLLLYHDRGTEDIRLADGDEYSKANSTRQRVNSEQFGKNKALATAENIPFPQIQAYPIYLTPETIHGFLDDAIPPVLFICAVDRDASRALTLQELDNRFSDYAWVSPGNDYDTAQVTLHLKQNNYAYTTWPLDLYANLRNPVDGHPGDCGEEQTSSPQLITANQMASCVALMYVTNLLDDRPLREEVLCDTNSLWFKPGGRYVQRTEESVSRST